MTDAVGLVEGLYPGAAAQGFRAFPESTDVRRAPDRRGLHGGHADAGAARARGADRRAQPAGRGAAQHRRAAAWPRGMLYPSVRHEAPERLPQSPVIGTGAPEQYERREDIGQPRKRLPAKS